MSEEEEKCRGLEEVWNESLAASWILWELLLVPGVMTQCSWSNVGSGEDGEGKSWDVPGNDSVSSPFNDLSQVVWARDILIEPSSWNLISGLSRGSQVDKDSVGGVVDVHSSEIKCRTEVVTPGEISFFSLIEGVPGSLHESIVSAEEHCGCHDVERR